MAKNKKVRNPQALARYLVKSGKVQLNQKVELGFMLGSSKSLPRQMKLPQKTRKLSSYNG